MIIAYLRSLDTSKSHLKYHQKLSFAFDQAMVALLLLEMPVIAILVLTILVETILHVTILVVAIIVVVILVVAILLAVAIRLS